MYYNKLLFFCIASYFTIISCKNNNKDNLNLEQFTVTLSSSGTPTSTTISTATGQVECGQYRSNFNLTESNSNIYIAKYNACTITFSSVNFTENSNIYNFQDNIVIQLDPQNTKKTSVYYKNKVNNKDFYVSSSVDIGAKKISISFLEKLATQNVELNQTNKITLVSAKINFNIIPAPLDPELHLTQFTYETGTSTKIHYHLNNKSTTEVQNGNCIIVSEKVYNNNIKSFENISAYLSSASSLIPCPNFLEDTKNMETKGNWDDFATEAQYIILSTYPIKEPLNNYRLIKIDKPS